jgi:hypothetical protein
MRLLTTSGQLVFDSAQSGILTGMNAAPAQFVSNVPSTFTVNNSSIQINVEAFYRVLLTCSVNLNVAADPNRYLQLTKNGSPFAIVNLYEVISGSVFHSRTIEGLTSFLAGDLIRF